MKKYTIWRKRPYWSEYWNRLSWEADDVNPLLFYITKLIFPFKFARKGDVLCEIVDGRTVFK